MKRKVLFVLLSVVVTFSFAGCGSSQSSTAASESAQANEVVEEAEETQEGNNVEEPEPKKEEKLDLSGNWEQVDKNPESYHAGYIKDGVIEIYWVSDTDSTTSLYWSGTYDEPAGNNEQYTWDSKNNTDKTGASIMASGDDTKTFKYENGVISYEASALGETATIELEKTDTDYTYLASETESSATEEGTFSNNVLVTSEYTITITDYKVIQPGEAGNEYGDKPIIAFWYDTTNTSGADDVDPTTAWIFSFKAIQDNDPNKINELNMASLPDDRFTDSQMEKIKSGGTVSNAEAYELDDLETPVTLKASDILGTSYGEQTFEIAGK